MKYGRMSKEEKSGKKKVGNYFKRKKKVKEVEWLSEVCVCVCGIRSCVCI